MEKDTIVYVTDSLIRAMFDDNVKREVLGDEWYDKNIESGIEVTGFCFAASEILYRLFGGKDNWYFMRVREEDWDHETHYFLKHKETGEVIDITSDQYTLKGIEVPYEKGKARGLMKVSNKAKALAKAANINIEV